ncbi:MULTISPECIES: MFS transporter [Bacillus]|uniref:MFS transporter n=1 Tax=Bacillus TaxID=1386 RepID=UPI0002D9283E|nr:MULTISPECIES: MFS transporter [Bacillus]
MKYSWLVKGDFFKLWSSTLLSQFSSNLFFYSLIWWTLSEGENLLTGSTIIAIGAAITLFLSPISGWLSDRFHRGRLLAIVDSSLCFMFIVLVFFSEFANFQSGLIVLLSRIIISAGLGSTDAAARSLIQQTIKEEQLNRALGFQESLSQISHLISPAIAGFLVYSIEISGVWITCGILFAISAFLKFFLNDYENKDKNINFSATNLFSGFSRIKNNKPLRTLLYGTSIQQLLFSGFSIYLAIWSTFLLKNNEWVSGMLQTFWAVGSFLGAILVVFILKVQNIKPLSVCLTLSLALLVGPLGFTENIYIAITLLGLAGLASGILNVYLETHLQQQTTPEHRGREISAFFAINNVLMPFGYALAGILAKLIPLKFLFLVVVIPIPVMAIFIFKSFTAAHSIKKLKEEVPLKT